MWLWERIRELPKFEPYVENYEADPETMMGKVARMAFKHANPKLPLYGIYPPRTTLDLIPPDDVEGWEFSDDASELFNKWWNPKQRYINLLVKRPDIENRLQEMSK